MDHQYIPLGKSKQEYDFQLCTVLTDRKFLDRDQYTWIVCMLSLVCNHHYSRILYDNHVYCMDHPRILRNKRKHQLHYILGTPR